MTRETKVGLLVGLAFIVLFGIILSEKGGQQPAGQYPDYPQIRELTSIAEQNPADAAESSELADVASARADSSSRSHTLSDADAIADDRGYMRMATRGDDVMTRDHSSASGYAADAHVRHHGNPIDDQMRVPQEAQQTNPSESIMPPNQRANERIEQYMPVGDTAIVSASQQQVPAPASHSTSQDADSANGRLVQVGPAETDPTPGRVAVSIQPQRSAPARDTHTTSTAQVPAAPQVQYVEYTVQPGDSLIKIASKVYGPDQTQRYREIYQANKDTLPDVRKMHVGKVLRIPVQVAGASGGTPAVIRSAGSGATSDLSPTVVADGTGAIPASANPDGDNGNDGENKVRTYVVKPRDTLAGIAKREYGRQSHWRVIYELNRDKIKEPKLLRAGMKISLPESLASATLGTN